MRTTKINLTSLKVMLSNAIRQNMPYETNKYKVNIDKETPLHTIYGFNSGEHSISVGYDNKKRNLFVRIGRKKLYYRPILSSFLVMVTEINKYLK